MKRMTVSHEGIVAAKIYNIQVTKMPTCSRTQQSRSVFDSFILPELYPVCNVHYPETRQVHMNKNNETL